MMKRIPTLRTYQWIERAHGWESSDSYPTRMAAQAACSAAQYRLETPIQAIGPFEDGYWRLWTVYAPTGAADRVVQPYTP